MMDSNTKIGCPCFRIFVVPELARLICMQMELRKSDIVHLFRTCRLLFHKLCQYAWESTGAVFSLISMIPGGELLVYSDDMTWEYHTTMQFPATLDLSRLSLYSHCVRDLEIAIERIYADRYEGWDQFLACARSTDLLPNLKRMRITSYEDVEEVPITTDLANWITTFWSSSLLSFEMIQYGLSSLGNHGHLWTELGLAHRFLGEMSDRCPQLDLLKFFPGNIEISSSFSAQGEWESDIPSAEYYSASPKTYAAILRLQNLRTLSTTPFFLENDIFLALAQLPSLETLSIHNIPNNQQEYAKNIQLPNQSFPSLRNITLDRLTWDTVSNLIHQRSIWKGIHTVRIQFNKPHERPKLESNPYMWSGLISALAEHRSSVTSIFLSESTSPQRITPQMVQQLKTLSLKTLSLTSLNNTCSDWINIVYGLSEVEDLTLSVHVQGVLPLEFHEIIASMPRLCRLRLPTSTDFVDRLEEDAFPPRPYSSSEIWLATRFHLRGDDSKEGAKKVARQILTRNETQYNIPPSEIG